MENWKQIQKINKNGWYELKKLFVNIIIIVVVVISVIKRVRIVRQTKMDMFGVYILLFFVLFLVMPIVFLILRVKVYWTNFKCKNVFFINFKI